MLAPAREDISGLCEIDRVHTAGTSAAVWAFGGAHIKAKAWVPELESEADTIKHVRQANIPVPEVVFSWVDRAWHRSFSILKSVPGSTLYQAWPELSLSQKQKVASEVASFCSKLGASRKPRMETLSGKGVREDYLTKERLPNAPSWKPVVEGPFTAEQLKAYLQDFPITTGDEFYFYHADLGPTNIILDDERNVAAIIDWESAAFYPRFWIATKPLVSAGFNLGGADRYEWGVLLSRALEEKGFKADVELYRSWSAALAH